MSEDEERGTMLVGVILGVMLCLGAVAITARLRADDAEAAWATSVNRQNQEQALRMRAAAPKASKLEPVQLERLNKLPAGQPFGPEVQSMCAMRDAQGRLSYSIVYVNGKIELIKENEERK